MAMEHGTAPIEQDIAPMEKQKIRFRGHAVSNMGCGVCVGSEGRSMWR